MFIPISCAMEYVCSHLLCHGISLFPSLVPWSNVLLNEWKSQVSCCFNEPFHFLSVLLRLSIFFCYNSFSVSVSVCFSIFFFYTCLSLSLSVPVSVCFSFSVIPVSLFLCLSFQCHCLHLSAQSTLFSITLKRSPGLLSVFHCLSLIILYLCVFYCLVSLSFSLFH